jgi:hypothetical protein
MKPFINPTEEELNQISIACNEDERLREILGRILSFTEEEKKKFRQKMTVYFLGTETPEDIKTKQFFTILLEEDYALKVAKKAGIK